MRFINMHDGTGDEHCVFQNQVIASADEKTSFAQPMDLSSGLASVPRSLGGFVYAIQWRLFQRNA